MGSFAELSTTEFYSLFLMHSCTSMELYIVGKEARARKIRQNANIYLALRKNHSELAKLMALNSVLRCAHDFDHDRRIPRGWRRNCMNKGYSRINLRHNDHGVLACIFEDDRSMAAKDGLYVGKSTDPSVAATLGIELSSDWAYRRALNFPGHFYRPTDKQKRCARYRGIKILADDFHDAWDFFLKHSPSDAMAA